MKKHFTKFFACLAALMLILSITVISTTAAEASAQQQLGEISETMGVTPGITLNKVEWINGDGEVLDTDAVANNLHAFYEVWLFKTPTKTATDEFTYKFLGWNTDPDATEILPLVGSDWLYRSPAITADTKFYAIFEAVPVDEPQPTYYTVKWVNGDETLWTSLPVLVNGTASYVASEGPTGDNGVMGIHNLPTKATDAQYSYTFIGWNTDPDATEALPLQHFTLNASDIGGVDDEFTIYLSEKITGDTTYYAIFAKTPVPPKYSLTIHYEYADGSKAFDDYTAADLSDGFVYSVNSPKLDGYTPSQALVSGSINQANVELTVTYNQVAPKQYTITWIVNGKEYKESYQQGQMPAYKGSTDKAADDKYTYTFDKWTPEIVAATADATYTAQYKQTAKVVVPEQPATGGSGDVALWTGLGLFSVVGLVVLVGTKKKLNSAK